MIIVTETFWTLYIYLLNQNLCFSENKNEHEIRFHISWPLIVYMNAILSLFVSVNCSASTIVFYGSISFLCGILNQSYIVNAQFCYKKGPCILPCLWCMYLLLWYDVWPHARVLCFSKLFTKQPYEGCTQLHEWSRKKSRTALLEKRTALRVEKIVSPN